MMTIYVICSLTLLVQLGFGLVVLRQRKKLKKAVFIERVGDKVYLVDHGGNIISEKLILDK